MRPAFCRNDSRLEGFQKTSQPLTGTGEASASAANANSISWSIAGEVLTFARFNFGDNAGVKRLGIGFASVALIGVVIGCSGGSSGPIGKASDVAPAPTGAFMPVAAVFSQRCVGCHQGAQANKGVQLDTYANVMKGGSGGAIVVAGDVQGSLLSKVLRGRDGAKQMPPGQPISEDEIERIEDWISAGARE
jgi:cytochrome c551/c552